MIKTIVAYGNQSLRKKSEEIEPDYEGLETLIDDMFETMYKSDGIGLAAPQIGKSIRLFVIDASVMADDDPTLDGFKKVFINAQKLDESGEEWEFNEGCLSLPAIREDIKRKEVIRLSYLDENFNPHEEVFDGIKARIIQHEYDHLEGVLFIDHVSPLRKRLLKSKLNAIEKGKVSTNYKIKFAKK